MSNIQQFDAVKAKLAEFSESAKVEVNDDASMNLALEKAREAKNILNNIEAIRTGAVKPLNDRVKEINAAAKVLVAMVDIPLDHNKKQLIGWERVKEQARREELAKAEAARKEKEEEAKRESELDSMFGGVSKEQAEVVADMKALEIGAAHKASVSSIEQNKVRGTRKVWTFEITDSGLIPKDFLIVDDRKVRAAINEGVREIPGIKIFEETKIAIC